MDGKRAGRKEKRHLYIRNKSIASSKRKGLCLIDVFKIQQINIEIIERKLNISQAKY